MPAPGLFCMAFFLMLLLLGLTSAVSLVEAAISIAREELAAIKPLLDTLGAAGFAWLVVGGVLYTVGIIFFILDTRYPHAHGIWHLFVLAGSTAHYVAIARYVL